MGTFGGLTRTEKVSGVDQSGSGSRLGLPHHTWMAMVFPFTVMGKTERT
jgi:hypothetical protein